MTTVPLFLFCLGLLRPGWGRSFARGALPLALHEEAFSCLLNSVGQLGSGLPCSVDPRVWLLDEVVKCLKERKSVVQVRIAA